MPDKSFIDIDYIIKEQINNKEEKKEDYFSEKKLKIKDAEIDLNSIKFNSEKIKKTKQENKNNNNNIPLKKYNTPLINKKTPSILPKSIQLNLAEENNDDDLTQKIFSKIFNNTPKEKIKNSIEIIEAKEFIEDCKEEKDISNNIIDENLIQDYETFCLGIFISGLKPANGNNIISENSYNFVSSCGHKNCSLLLSMKPELILTYFNKKSHISQELNNLVANLCFPLGIKLCLEIPGDYNNYNKDKKFIQNSQNIFYNIIKNAKDEIFYMATLQYFFKMELKNFKGQYKFDLISYYSQINNNDNKDKNLKKALSLIKGLKENDIIYVPESISLLSKYPFFFPMKYCLNSIISLQTQEEKNNLINHIINEVPFPQKIKQIQFYIPLYKDPIILNHSFNIFKGISMMSDSKNNNIIDNLSMSQLNSKLLLEKISIENIIILFQLILLEQQILIIENNYQILSEIIFILISLVYPLTWTNPFLPILSLTTVEYLQSPVPFIMGLDEYLLKYAYNSKKIYIGKEIIMFNLMTKNFILSRTRKKANKKEIMHEFKLNFLPVKIENFMNIELKKIKIIMNSNKINDIDLDMEIRLVFLKTMICLIGDYNNYTFYKNDDDMPLFNKEAFIESHKEKEIKLFYGQMTKTQLFNQFLLNERQLYFFNNKNKKKININNKNNNILDEDFDINNCIDTSYFKKMIQKYPELINNEEIRKSSLDLNINTNIKNNEFLKVNRSQSNKNINLKFDTKKEISNSINFNNNPITINKKKITIDFTNFSLNSPEILNLKKSHNFNLQSKIDYNNNNINNDLNIRKSVTNKYNNIIIKKANKIKKYLLYPYFLPKIKKEEIKLLTQKKLNDKIILYNNNNNYQFILSKKQDKIFIIQKSLNYNFNQFIRKNIYIIDNHNNNVEGNIHKNLTEKNVYTTNESKSSAFAEGKSSKSLAKEKKKSKFNNIKKRKEKNIKINNNNED